MGAVSKAGPEAGPSSNDFLPLSCLRCRKRKIKCDRRYPCNQCIGVDVECRNGPAEKRRPVSKLYVEALETQIASLEQFIADLTSASSSERDKMLQKFRDASSADHFGDKHDKLPPSLLYTGRLLRRRDGKAVQFYGETSFFNIGPSASQEAPEQIHHVLFHSPVNGRGVPVPEMPLSDVDISSINYNISPNLFAPTGAVCQQLISLFFNHQYTDYMCLYREFFLRDYKASGGLHYSDLLLYAICSIGALASNDYAIQNLSDTFANRAQELLYLGALDSPNLTTIQALLLLGVREIGRGRSSKGWIFTGIAFRLAHEMGLHLDPNHWKIANGSAVEREILRRVYWAAFVADKQLSLYFGRPPALSPDESDVDDTVRISYPPEWNTLLENYIKKNTTTTEYEDGAALVNAFTQQVKLSKIVHSMITEVFENRHPNSGGLFIGASAKAIRVSLTKWLDELPNSLYWNKWSRGRVAPYIIYLHMYFHTVMIVLHRPPRNATRSYLTTITSDLETCYNSLDCLMQLLKVYSRYYSYNHLPVTFLQTAACAASVILLKQYVERPTAASGDSESAEQLDLIILAIDHISLTWTLAKQIKKIIVEATESIAAICRQEKGADISGGGMELNCTTAGSLESDIDLPWLDWLENANHHRK